MNRNIGNWFVSKLDVAEIKQTPLENHYPLSVPSFGVSIDDWSAVASICKNSCMRLISIWASEEKKPSPLLYAYAVFAHPTHRRVMIRTALNLDAPILPSISSDYIPAIRMERTIQDMFGIKMEGLTDERQWIKHEHWADESYPLRSSFKADAKMATGDGEYQFLKTESDGVYEIPVGPVHAGIIEPGHFRFLAVGEEVLHLEERLGYVHKGIEKRIAGMRATDAIKLASRVSGDTTIGHSWGFARACETASSFEVTDRANALRGILCERERMANHVGDIGAICNDVAFAFMNFQMQRLREEMARVHKKIFGHRLLMNTIAIGGVNINLNSDSIKELAKNTESIAQEAEELRKIYNDNASIQERVIGSGIIEPKVADEIGLLGVVGRASSFVNDVRLEATYSPYDKINVSVFHKGHGDVATRISVRFEEIQESARIINELLDNLPEGKIISDWQPPKNCVSGFATIEGWRGEIAYWVRFGNDGVIERCMIKDPSVVNWLGLEIAVRGLPVPDFPLINKSFNCSYSGNDL